MSNKSIINYVMGWLLFLTVFGLAFSGFVRWLILPSPGRGGIRGLEPFFIFTRHTWTDIHHLLAIIFSLLVLIHIYLHWEWFVSTTRKVFGLRKH
ncbi:MAG: DUF4405 domain-containing protein [Bacillota bacterium]|uniref:DUF4405 domain-containing protein n=1 Tax=Desulforamulus profundi TaxID=1383067 RepID=UPI000C000438|nr:DUF4405 domain-containing protein [Desulforamulus profundi]